MPATSARLHAAALLGYVSVAVLFTWPLPIQLSSALLGPPAGDTGVYVWNLWVFRHEIVANGRFPFFTFEILNASQPVPLTLHNYTTAANVLAFPLLPLVGTVATFNLLMLASLVASAHMTFLFLRERVGDNAGAWIGGLLFGFSPFMTAREIVHFSLVQAAALPAFALLLYRFRTGSPTPREAIAGGAIIAWAFLSDVYYGVYCALMAAFVLAWEAVALERRREVAPFPLRVAVNVAIMCVGGVVAAIVLRGGGSVELWGLRLSMTHLYTPVLLLTALTAIRVWIAVHPRVTWSFQPIRRFVSVGALGAISCIVVLSPVLSAMGTHIGDGGFIAPKVLWRSSAPGVDLLALLVPNPVGFFTEWIAADWVSTLPNGFHENVAAIPWTATFAIAIALLYARLRLPAYWVVFTVTMALLALGPFVKIGGLNTYVPTPWTLLRYVPLVGAARMPTRFTVLVMLGIAVLMAFALRALRARSARPWIPSTIVGALMLIELYPGPRMVYDATVPSFTKTIAADPRDLRVMNLPFGIRDGLSSTGNATSFSQFMQTFHEKPLVGGYLSRLPADEVSRFRQFRLFRLLFDLSEGREVSAARMERAIEEAHTERAPLEVGYVIVDTTRASPQLLRFVESALDLQRIATEGTKELYIVR